VISSRNPRIRRISTVRAAAVPNLTWVEIETDDGLVGLGETFSLGDAVEAYVHEGAATYLLGEDASAVQRHWLTLYRQRGRSGIGAETRGAAAIDIALWDLVGKRSSQPLHQLLGGRAREAIRVYNTCGGPNYVRERAVAGRLYTGDVESGRQYEDLHAFQTNPVELAESLLDMGISAMKIWPFDEIAVETGGNFIDQAQLERGMAPLVRIRESGIPMDVALEMHGRWTVPAAIQIARAAEQYRPMWIEDPIRLDNLGALAQFCRSTRIPTLVGETLGGRFHYREVLERTDVSIIMTDPCWVGGVTEARRVADLAALYQKPFTPHDCTGPIGLAVGAHLCLYAETAIFQEIVRAFYFGWYQELVDGLPALAAGVMTPDAGPGHGISFKAEFYERPDVTTQRSEQS
jgi:L-alanine-DL-glutamate epimerase-like enolase superfamily enzyme